MQVVILCGGQGTRIRDVAEDVPKPMIPIGGKPILWHIMKTYAHHGFHDFVLCLGYKGWVVKRFFLDYHLAATDLQIDLGTPGRVDLGRPTLEENWKVTLAETGLEAMTGCRVKRIEKYITADTFLLTYGDGVANVDIRQLVEFHKAHGKLGTITAVRPPGRFGEIELDGRRVVDFTEKPLLSAGRINGGYFVFSRRLFERLPDDPTLIFEHGPLTQLAHDGELMAFPHDDFWQPMDNSREYKYLNELWADGKAPWKCWDKSPLRLAA